MTIPPGGVATGPPDPHPNDGVLLALLDAELDDERRPELEAASEHVPGCEVCRDRSAAMEATSRQVCQALASIPIPRGSEAVLRRRIARAEIPRVVVPLWRRPTWQAAAAGVVLAAVAAASPVRHWLLRRLDSPQAVIQSGPAPASVHSTQPTNPLVNRSAIVSFAPSGAEFTVRFDSLPAAGVLTAERTTAGEVSARALNGANADPLLVLPGALRVRNETTSRTSYVVSLPASVHRLRVIVAGDTVFDGAPPAIVRLDRRR